MSRNRLTAAFSAIGRRFAHATPTGIVAPDARGGFRIPSVGDPVWWAPKFEPCVVTRVNRDGTFEFQSAPKRGQLVRRPNGKLVPRYTALTAAENATWDAATELWVVGEGSVPTLVRGGLVYPEPKAKIAAQLAQSKAGHTIIRPDPVNAGVGTAQGRVV